MGGRGFAFLLVAVLAVTGALIAKAPTGVVEGIADVEVASALPPVGDGLYTGSVVLVTSNGTYLATLMYARGADATLGLSSVLAHERNESTLPENVDEPLRSRICAAYACNVTRSAADDVRENMSLALGDLGADLGLLPRGAASANATLSSGSIFLLEIVRAEAKVDPDAAVLRRQLPLTVDAMEPTVDLIHEVCQDAVEASVASERLETVCPTASTGRVLFAAWDPSLRLHADLEAPYGTVVLGPLSWRVRDAAAEGHERPLFLPTAAIVSVSVAVLLGLLVNPLTRRFIGDPFLPVPLLASMLGLVLLWRIDHGLDLWNAYLTTLIVFGSFYAGILIWYMAGGLPVFHVLSGWIALVGFGIGLYLLLRAVVGIDRASPTALITMLYDDTSSADAIEADVLMALRTGGGIVLLGLIVALVGTVAGLVSDWRYRVRRARGRGAAERPGPLGYAAYLARIIRMRRRQRRISFGVRPLPIGGERTVAFAVYQRAYWREAAEWNRLRRGNRYWDDRERRVLARSAARSPHAARLGKSFDPLGPARIPRRLDKLEYDSKLIRAYTDAVRASRSFARWRPRAGSMRKRPVPAQSAQG